MSEKTELLNDIDVLRSYYSPDTPEHSTLKRAWEAIDADGWRRIEDGLPTEKGFYLTCEPDRNVGNRYEVTPFIPDDPICFKGWRERFQYWMPIPPFTE